MLSTRHLKHLGATLKELRNASRFTQAEVCGHTGLRAPQVSRWENGHEVPTLESLIKYLAAIGASLADLERKLLGEEDEKRQVKVAKVVREIRDGHQRRIRSSPDLCRAVREIMRPNPEGLERPRRVRFLEGKLGGGLGSRKR